MDELVCDATLAELLVVVEVDEAAVVNPLQRNNDHLQHLAHMNNTYARGSANREYVALYPLTMAFDDTKMIHQLKYEKEAAS